MEDVIDDEVEERTKENPKANPKAKPKSKAKAKQKTINIRKPGNSKLSSINVHSTGEGGSHYQVRMTRNETDLLEDLEKKYKKKLNKANRAKIFRACILMLSDDTKSRNLLVEYMKLL